MSKFKRFNTDAPGNSPGVVTVSNGVTRYEMQNGPRGVAVYSSSPGAIAVTDGTGSKTWSAGSLTLSGNVIGAGAGILKRFVRLTGFIATVTAGMVLLAATDGASAKDSGGGRGGDGNREGGPSPATNPIWSTIHPMIYTPGSDHDSDRCHEHDRCDVRIRFLGPPVPAPIYAVKSAPVASAPGAVAPVLADAKWSNFS
jgi:hypothetical protein